MKKALRDISNRHSINQLFDDFLQMAVCAFSVGFMEEEYKKVADKYKPEELKGFSIALAEMVNEYSEAACDGGWDDIVGITFENVNSKMQASNSGQFFTPVHLCNLMAKITHDSTFIPENVNDCACGSSRNLIAHCRLRPEHRTETFYHAYDLDSRCVLMSVINFIMYGMKGVVIHMNALTLEIYGGLSDLFARNWIVCKADDNRPMQILSFQSKRKGERANNYNSCSTGLYC